MDKFMLTEQHIENATAYLPIAVKAALAQVLAEQCVEAIESPYDGVPPVYQLSSFNRELGLMSVLAVKYLKLVKQEENGVRLNAVEYDYYAAGGVWDCVSDTQSSPLQRDFARFKDMLDVAIRSELMRLNDPCARLIKMMEAQSTPEAVSSAMEQMKNVQADLANFKPLATAEQAEFDEATRDMQVL